MCLCILHLPTYSKSAVEYLDYLRMFIAVVHCNFCLGLGE